MLGIELNKNLSMKDENNRILIINEVQRKYETSSNSRKSKNSGSDVNPSIETKEVLVNALESK